MLHDDDAALVARDRRIPGLALLLDDEAMGAALRRAAPEVDLASVEAHYLRYKPGTNCLCRYRLRTRSGASTSIYAKAFAAGDPGLEKVHQPVADSMLGPDLPGTILLADALVRVWAYPNDQRVRALDRAGGDESRARLLRRVLPDRRQWWNASVEMLAYKPDRRFVGRLDVDGRPVAALRLYTRAGFARAHQRARFVAATGHRELPLVHGVSERHGAIVYDWIEGRSLLDDLIDGELRADRFEAAGAALARLHRLPPRELPRLAADDESAALRAAAAEIELLAPELAPRALALAGVLEAELRGRFDPATLHGDFYAKQVVASAGGVGLIDLDGACAGDPSRDLGNFLAHLERYRSNGRVAERLAGPAGAALIAGYRGAGGTADGVKVRPRVAASLLHLASHPFRRREPDWKRAMTAMLDAAERSLEVDRMATV